MSSATIEAIALLLRFGFKSKWSSFIEKNFPDMVSTRCAMTLVHGMHWSHKSLDCNDIHVQEKVSSLSCGRSQV